MMDGNDESTQPWHWFPLIPLHVFTSVKRARKFVRNKANLRYEPSKNPGSITLYENDTSRESFAVMNVRSGPRDAKWFALIAHECVHYAQFVENMMDTEFDDETEAYVVQSAMLSALDQLGYRNG